LRPAFLVAIPEILVGQFHDDHELTVDDIKAFQRKNIGMADGEDAAEGFEFLLGTMVGVAGAAEVAENEFDGFMDAAGRLGLPDFAEAAAAQPLDEAVAGDRFGHVLDPNSHGASHRLMPRAQKRSRRHEEHSPYLRSSQTRRTQNECGESTYVTTTIAVERFQPEGVACAEGRIVAETAVGGVAGRGSQDHRGAQMVDPGPGHGGDPCEQGAG